MLSPMASTAPRMVSSFSWPRIIIIPGPAAGSGWVSPSIMPTTRRHWSVSGQPAQLAYAYAPGEEHDGVTIELPFAVAQSASAALLAWAVPGLREEMINELLRA